VKKAAGLALDNVSLAYDDFKVLSRVSLEVGAGEFVGLIGPNACGKSTLLKSVSRVLRPAEGRILLDGRDVWRRMSLAETAQSVAMVPQDFPLGFPFTVEETVLMGRLPYVTRLRGERPADLARVRQAMVATKTLELADRPLPELAGGDRQRVVLAKALAQDPRLLLLDEPTSHLDINHQVEILDLLLQLNRADGLTIVIVLHDLNLASMYCRRLVLLSGGGVVAEGPPAEVLTPENLAGVYGSRVLVGRHPVYGCPQVTLLSQLEAPRGALDVGEERRDAGPAADGFRIHLVAGGGSSADLLESLVAAGHRVSLGPVNAGDSDWEMARALAVDTITVPPFSPVGEEALARAGETMGSAGAVVVGPVPFGSGNVAILQEVLRAVKAGIPVVLVEPEDRPVFSRDFTGGRASALVRSIREAGAVPLADDRAVLEWAARAAQAARSAKPPAVHGDG